MKYGQFAEQVCKISDLEIGQHINEIQNKKRFNFINRILGLAYGKYIYTKKVKDETMIYTMEEVLSALSNANKFVDSIFNKIDDRQNLLIAQTKQNLERGFYDK